MNRYQERDYRGENRRQAIKHTTLYYVKRLVFSGFLVTALSLMLQIGIMVAIFVWLNHYANIYYEANILVTLVGSILIVNEESNPAYKITWIVLIAVFPFAGIILYFYTKYNFGTRAVRELAKSIGAETRKLVCSKSEVIEDLRNNHIEFDKLSRYLGRCGGAATYANSTMEYMPIGENAMTAILEELEQAKSFIFMEFFMVEEGVFFNSILEILERKVKEGVEVRFMYDDFGCVALLPRKYAETLREKGINAKVFSRIYPFLSTHYNNRDHRKIIVIDGKVAFTGGINLCDEYINAFEKYGHWKDNGVIVKGEAVKGFTMLFLQMWNAVNYKRNADYTKYMPDYPVKSKGYVIPYGDGPHRYECVAENVYLDILNQAKDYVYIMTPYLILDNEMERALCHAAREKVDVRIIIPHIPDKKIPFCIARTHYKRLRNAGVKIYEYTPGFVHSKTFLCDDRIATIGTVNLDFRSLYLHYECGCVFYETDGIEDIKADFENTFAKSILVDNLYYESIPLLSRIAGRVLRLLGPLM